jgi:2-dehydro-3-deoxygalactonokinase
MSEVDTTAQLITVDWGTSNLRASLIDAQGTIVDQINSDQGLLSNPTDFGACLSGVIQPWLERSPRTRTILSGMVGSPNGWIEVPHIPCPASPRALAAGAHAIDGFGYGGAWIVPGVSGQGAAGLHDVMRGEEVQFFGAGQLLAAQGLPQPQRWCFPGTHNKWIDAGAEITRFSTSMVGEFFDLAQRHSLLTQSITPEGPTENLQKREADFLRGVATSQTTGGLLHHLFSVRSLQLKGTHSKAQGAAYLSGILIGHDICSQAPDRNASIGIVASPMLADRYQLALTKLGYDCATIDAQLATAQGALLVAKHL